MSPSTRTARARRSACRPGGPGSRWRRRAGRRPADRVRSAPQAREAGWMTVEWQTSPDPGLRHPILVVAFEGWFDVARAATGAVQWLVDQFEATPLAAVDPEPYFD